MENHFTAVELFAGAGGLSLGLEWAGFDVVLANEMNSEFAETLRRNHPNTKIICEDVHGVDFATEMEMLGVNSPDLLSGGPPCQGFSTVGSKNRMDPRNSLFYEYLRAISEIRPKYTIFENVSGFKRMYGGFAFDTLEREMKELGYETKCRILNAAEFGVPQQRNRTVVIGWRNGLVEPNFPVPTHGQDKIPFVTLMDAIGDLPTLSCGESKADYSQEPQNEFQSWIRGDQRVLRYHDCSNYGERMRKILAAVPPGGSIGDLPQELRPKSAFRNTYARLFPDCPSPTITRNFGTPSSSRCIHPFQDRALSTREGARLQCFPDGYEFFGGKQLRNLQIGNAVPTLLAKAIANEIRKALTSNGEPK